MTLKDGERAIDVTLVHAPPQECLSALDAQQVERETPRSGSKRRKQRIEDDAVLVGRDGEHDHEIDDFRKRQERGVEKRDQEETGEAERERERLDAFEKAVHPGECRLRHLQRHRAVPLLIAAVSLLIGSAAALHYSFEGLSLSHYDARAHLVVARRIIDSLTPGWQQVGAVWLPLPHLLNMFPVQNDWLYRTGASGIALSVLSMAIAIWAIASLVIRSTGSVAGAIAAAALILLNPNVLYLQSTPMTEPMLFATTLVGVAFTCEWLDGLRAPTAGGLALAAACLTRYEAWPITAATVTLAALVLLRRGVPFATALTGLVRLASPAVAAIVLFLINSRWTIGSWFISSGFFVPENTEALGHASVAFAEVKLGLYHLSGSALVWSGYAGAALILVAFLDGGRPFAGVGRPFTGRQDMGQQSLLVLLAMAASAMLPWYAYLQGHPFRIRYDLPLVTACGAFAGAGIGLLWRPARAAGATLVVVAALFQSHPLDRTALLVGESQRDAANKIGRAAVTDYLVSHYDGGTIMMSMGSLGHYMHDLSAQGFRIRDFLHEGNGDIWALALMKPATVVRWIAIEEKAEGGDVLCQEARRHPRFLDGFERVAEGGGVALYRFDEVRGSSFETRTP